MLRGVSRDRLDLLGEEFFEYFLKPRLKQPRRRQAARSHRRGQRRCAGEPGPRPHHASARKTSRRRAHSSANRLDFRDGMATGRLLDPVIRPRGAFAQIHRQPARRPRLARKAYCAVSASTKIPKSSTKQSVRRARRAAKCTIPVVHFEVAQRPHGFFLRPRCAARKKYSADRRHRLHRKSMARESAHRPPGNRQDLSARAAQPREHLPRALSARGRRIAGVRTARANATATDSPNFCASDIEVVEGDVSKPGLGLSAARRTQRLSRIARRDRQQLRPHRFQSRPARRAGDECPLHRVRARFPARMRITPRCCIFPPATWSASATGASSKSCRQITRRSESRISTRKKNGSRSKLSSTKPKPAPNHRKSPRSCARRRSKRNTPRRICSGAALENQIRKNRVRWLRQTLTDAGTQRANELGWPNTYTFTKSLSESLIRNFLDAQPATQPSPSSARRSSNPPSKSRSSAGTKASTPPRRFPICWAHSSASCRPTNANAWT